MFAHSRPNSHAVNHKHSIALRGLTSGSSDLAAVAGSGYHRMAEADAAVVARDPGVREHGEAAGLQSGDGLAEEQEVLEDPARQGHRVQAVLLAQQLATAL